MPQQIREGQRVRMCCECKHMSPYGGLLACFRQSGLKGSAPPRWLSLFFFLNDPPPPEISPLSLHDALPIFDLLQAVLEQLALGPLGPRPRQLVSEEDAELHHSPGRYVDAHSLDDRRIGACPYLFLAADGRWEEHTSELQSQSNLVCRLLLEK